MNLLGDNIYKPLNVDGLHNSSERLNRNKAYLLIQYDDYKKTHFVKIYAKKYYKEYYLCETIMHNITHPNIIELEQIKENNNFIIMKYKYYPCDDLLITYSNNTMYNYICEYNLKDSIWFYYEEMS